MIQITTNIVSWVSQCQSVLTYSSASMLLVVSFVADKAFHFLKSTYYLLYGISESVYGFFFKRVHSLSIESLSNTAKKVISLFFKKLFSYNFLHGGCLVAAGISELIQGLNQYSLVSLGLAFPFIVLAGEVSLLFAYFLVLVRNLRICVKISEQPPLVLEEDIKNSNRLKTSAILNIFSALNYIAGISLALLGGPTTLIIVLLAFGLVSGGLAILFNILYPSKSDQLKNNLNKTAN